MILSSHEAPSALGVLSDIFLGRRGLLVPSWDNLMRTTEQEKLSCIDLIIVPISVVMMNCCGEQNGIETNSKAPTLYDLRKRAGRPNGHVMMTQRRYTAWAGIIQVLHQGLATIDSVGEAQVLDF
jgi:hypothetical protein